jgi:hypothetical protein
MWKTSDAIGSIELLHRMGDILAKEFPISWAALTSHE